METITSRNKNYRFRALDVVASKEKEWFNLNPLFKSYTNIFNTVFNRGISLNLNYYSKRKSNDKMHKFFEYEFIHKLFDQYSDKICKTSNLVGKVGSGKTAFINFIKSTMLEEYEKHEILPIHVDTFNQFTSNIDAEKKMISLFKREIENTLIKGENNYKFKTFKNKYEYLKSVLEHDGFSDLSQEAILKNQNSIDFYTFLRHLFEPEFYKKIHCCPK